MPGSHFLIRFLLKTLNLKFTSFKTEVLCNNASYEREKRECVRERETNEERGKERENGPKGARRLCSRKLRKCKNLLQDFAIAGRGRVLNETRSPSNPQMVRTQ